MGGDRYQSGSGTIATFFMVVIGIPLALFAIVAVFAALMAVTVGWPA